MSGPRLSCEEIRRLLMDYLKQEMTPDAEKEVRRHLNHCRHCDDHADFERNFVRLLEERLRRDTCPERLRERLQRILGEEPG